MTTERSNTWLFASLLAATMLVGCGGGEATAVSSGEAAPPAAVVPPATTPPATTPPVTVPPATTPPADPGGSGGSGNPVTTGSATLSWSAPVENTDGTSVTNLAGYRIYHGTSPSALDSMIQVSNPGITLYVVESLAPGTHYFAISAYNAAGVEGDRSSVGSKSIL